MRLPLGDGHTDISAVGKFFSFEGVCLGDNLQVVEMAENVFFLLVVFLGRRYCPLGVAGFICFPALPMS